MRSLTRLSVVTIFALIVCVSALANPRVETVRFQSKLVNAALPYNVILPADYDTSPTTLPGDHSWAYWDQQVQHILQIASQKMRMPPSPKTNHTSTGTRGAGA